MIKRILSTIFILAVLTLSIYFGGAHGFSALILVLALLASYEACQLEKKCGLSPRFWVVAAAVCAFFAGQMLPSFGKCGAFADFLAPQAVLAYFLIAALKSPYSGYPAKTLVAEFLTALIVGASLACFVKLAFFDIKIAVWSAFVIKFSDIGGYLFGAYLGRNKIAPTISPKKTWEGLLGGMFLSAAGGVLIAHYLIAESFKGLPPALIGVLCAAIAVVALLSDLAESALKRRAGVKDSGSTLPGIGGALDLADSMVLSAPIMAAFIFALV